MDEGSVEEAAGGQRVVRDIDFKRIYADNGLASFLGRDVEMALLTISADMHVIGTAGNLADVDGETVFAEVARIRMAPAGAVTLAMNIFLVMIANGLLSVEAFEERFAELRGNFAGVATDSGELVDEE